MKVLATFLIASIETVQGLTSPLFTAADAACNRAFEFHAQSTAFARAQDSFDKARTTSDATPAAARPFLDEAEKALSSERLFQR